MHTEFKPEDPEVLREMGYDTRDMKMPLLRKYIIWITASCVASFLIAVPAYNYFSTDGSLLARLTGSERQPGQKSKNHIQPPNPLLQDNFTTKKDIKDLRRHEDDVLGSYGWVDQNKGQVHIPIEKAMSEIVKNGVSTGNVVPAKTEGNTIKQNAVGPGSSQQH